MSNMNTRKITMSSVVGSVAFRRGTEDFKAGRGFPKEFDSPEWRDLQWHYERGRQVAAACQAAGWTVLPNRDGRKVSRMAINQYAALRKSGSVR